MSDVDFFDARPDTDRPPCMKCGKRPKLPGKHRCYWCWLDAQDINIQLEQAEKRQKANIVSWQEDRQFYNDWDVADNQPKRPPKKTWPPESQWCSTCFGFVPIDYARGSKCKAHASRAAHAASVAKKYGIDQDTYDALLEWQDGRCYICGNKPRTKRLAVDHDHKTGAVRGLLCADNEFGCNFALGGISTLERALRAASYFVRTPMTRMTEGEPPRSATWTPESLGVRQEEEVPSDEEAPAFASDAAGSAIPRKSRRYGYHGRRGRH